MDTEVKLTLGGIVGFILVIIAFNLWGSNDYAEYKIRQAPGSGEMSIISEPGMYWDGFADISTYKVSGDIDFKEVTTMSDGAKVTFSGSVKFRLPSDEKTRLKLHKDFGSYDNVVENLIKKNTIDVLSNKTAPMFTASDTYSARKPEIARVLEGQLQNGAYDVFYEDVKMPDGTKYRLAKVRLDENGKPKIIGKNLLNEYGIESIPFVDGYPDFSEVSRGQVKIDDFTEDRDANFAQADEKLAEQRGCTPQEVKAWREAHGYTWHECEDCKTMQKVPTEVHGNVSHSGGISVYKSQHADT